VQELRRLLARESTFCQNDLGAFGSRWCHLVERVELRLRFDPASPLWQCQLEGQRGTELELRDAAARRAALGAHPDLQVVVCGEARNKELDLLEQKLLYSGLLARMCSGSGAAGSGSGAAGSGSGGGSGGSRPACCVLLNADKAMPSAYSKAVQAVQLQRAQQGGRAPAAAAGLPSGSVLAGQQQVQVVKVEVQEEGGARELRRLKVEVREWRKGAEKRVLDLLIANKGLLLGVARKADAKPMAVQVVQECFSFVPLYCAAGEQGLPLPSGLDQLLKRVEQLLQLREQQASGVAVEEAQACLAASHELLREHAALCSSAVGGQGGAVRAALRSGAEQARQQLQALRQALPEWLRRLEGAAMAEAEALLRAAMEPCTPWRRACGR
jgi:hypothetical protein